MNQFLSEEAAFPRLLDFAETLGPEETHQAAAEEWDRHSAKVVREAMERLPEDPSEEERRELTKIKRMHSPIKWLDQQLYSCLALNCKGEALAMIRALAATEYEGHRGITAWNRLTRDYRGSDGQRILGLVQRIFQPPRITKMSETVGALELWETRIREYERLVARTENLFRSHFGSRTSCRARLCLLP